jgi:16S rRNA (uracil1498-N3)-methyltransferase
MPQPEGGTPKVRLYVSEPLAAGGALALDPAPSHYVRNLMRLGPGDRVALFNGVEGEWLAEIESYERRVGRLRVHARLREQTEEPGPALLFAPIKRTRLEMLVEKATELGAAALEPVVTRRTVVGRIDPERLLRIAIEAAEQCGRLTLPRIAEPRRLADRFADWPAGRRLYLCDATGRGRPIAAALAEFGAGDLLVGPEGGFAPEELAELRASVYVTPVDLGPRVLRAETAALVALGCWHAVLNPGG